MIEIVLKFDSPSEALAALNLLAGGPSTTASVPSFVPPSPEPDPTGNGDKPKRTRRTKAEMEAARAAEAAAAKAQAAPAPDDDEADGLTYEADVRPLLSEAAKHEGIGMKTAMELLQRYGVRKGTELKPAQLPQIRDELRSMIDAANAGEEAGAAGEDEFL